MTAADQAGGDRLRQVNAKLVEFLSEFLRLEELRERDYAWRSKSLGLTVDPGPSKLVIKTRWVLAAVKGGEPCPWPVPTQG